MSLGRLAISLPLPSMSVPECAALARRAEREWGYEACWIAETNGPDAFVLAAAVAAATERMRIGTAVVPVYTRTPAVLSMAAGGLAQLSGDRFVLGLGSSSHAIVEQWNGLSFEAPLGTLREACAILRTALAGGRTDFAGERLRSRGFRLAALPSKPVPIYLGALRERMLALAGEIGDGVVLNLFPVTALPRMLAAHREGGAAAGRDVSGHEVVCRFQVAVTDDVERARNVVRAVFGPYVATPVYNRFFAWCGFEAEAKGVAEAFARGDRTAVAAAMTDELVDRVTILGPAEACRAQLAEFVAAGVTTPVISPLAADRAAIEATFAAFAPALTGGRA